MIPVRKLMTTCPFKKFILKEPISIPKKQWVISHLNWHYAISFANKSLIYIYSHILSRSTLVMCREHYKNNICGSVEDKN